MEFLEQPKDKKNKKVWVIQIVFFAMAIAFTVFGTLSVISIIQEGVSVENFSFELSVIINNAVFVFVLVMLIKLIETLKKGSPFIKKNVSRLRIIALILILVDVLFQGLYIVFNYLDIELIETLLIINSTLLVKNFGGLFTGAILLVIAEIFRVGIKIKFENELTV